jgi:hypothetical protein
MAAVMFLLNLPTMARALCELHALAADRSLPQPLDEIDMKEELENVGDRYSVVGNR